MYKSSFSENSCNQLMVAILLFQPKIDPAWLMRFLSHCFIRVCPDFWCIHYFIHICLFAAIYKIIVSVTSKNLNRVSVRQSKKRHTSRDAITTTQMAKDLLIYYPTTLRRVQITLKTSTNITRYLYSRGPVRQVSCHWPSS